MAEWFIAIDCKSIGGFRRWFESVRSVVLKSLTK